MMLASLCGAEIGTGSDVEELFVNMWHRSFDVLHMHADFFKSGRMTESVQNPQMADYSLLYFSLVRLLQ